MLTQKDISRYRRLPAAAQAASVDSGAAASVLPNGLWRGRRAFIVGGGPSLNGFDWSLLKGECVIGINRAFEFCDPAIHFSMDGRYWRDLGNGRYGAGARDRFLANGGPIRVWLNAAAPESLPGGALQVSCCGAQGWSWDIARGLGGGRNSGYGALNLACVLGANPIYLLGFDMKGGADGRQAWFHDGHPNIQQAGVYDRFVSEFERVAPEIAAHGIRVVNLNRESALRCFEFGDFPEAIERPMVVAYFTEGTGYEQEAERLRRSVMRFGLEHVIVGTPNLGSWQANTQHKPSFLLSQLVRFPGRALLYADADAAFQRYPALFDGARAWQCSPIGMHFRDRGPGRAQELLSGTIWLRGDEACREVVARWASACKSSPNEWDQRVLADVLCGSGFSYWKLPPEYCAIFDQGMCAPGAAVIEHFQASRRLKAEVGRRKSEVKDEKDLKDLRAAQGCLEGLA